MSPRKPLFRLRDYLTPKIWLVGLFFLLIVGYAAYSTSDYLRGPRLAIAAPDNYSTVHDPLIEIRGEAERISHIFLNQGQIFTDETGQFKQKLLLAPGYNIITLEVRDQFGRHVKRTLELVYN